MTIYIHNCDGCTPQPLANYLKALGILRLIAEQKDSNVRGWWEGDRFRLATTLDEQALMTFFLDEYQPTPLISPWNKGSGFFKVNDPALTPIANSKAPRLQPYAKAIAVARELLGRIEEADSLIRAIKARTKTNRTFQSQEQRTKLAASNLIKKLFDEVKLELKKAEDNNDQDKIVTAQTTLKEIAELITQRNDHPTKKEAEIIKDYNGYKRLLSAADREFKALKADLIPACRRLWRGGALEWMDCAMVLDAEGQAACPALLGTGGNDGKLDFTNKFMDRINVVFNLQGDIEKTHPQTSKWISNSIFGSTVKGFLTGKDGKVGQFSPGGAGGANLTAGFGGQDETLLNPFDYLLMMEGCLIFVAAMTKRNSPHSGVRATAPFAIGSQAAGYASAGASDEGFRGEQWMPLWSAPLSQHEVHQLFAEGRAQLGPQLAQEPLDLARAVVSLGVARGIHAFERFGYIERNGQSNLAVPLGRFFVPESPAPNLACLDDLAGWLTRLHRHARDDRAPIRLQQAERKLSEMLFSLVQNSGEAIRWQSVLIALGEVEKIMVAGSGFAAGPIPQLRPDWAKMADDGSATFRLALAFALQVGDDDRSGQPLGGIRRHIQPMKGTRFHTRSDGLRQSLLTDPGVVMHGRDGIADAIALVSRRLIEAAQAGQRHIPLQACRGAGVEVDDLVAVLNGAVNLDQVLSLARGLMAINHYKWLRSPQARRVVKINSQEQVDEAWIAIRLAMLPWALPHKPLIGADPAILRRLSAGDANTAIDMALRRLRIAGITATIRTGTVDSVTARRWAAALAFPISLLTAKRLASQLDSQYTQELSHVR